MFRLVFSKETRGPVVPLQVCGIRGSNSTVVWGSPIEYQRVKKFIDGLNRDGLPEDKLFDATLEFLVELVQQLWLSQE